MPTPSGQRSSGGLVRLALGMWTVIGAMIVLTAIVGMLAAVSEIVMPLIFAVMLGAAAYPMSRRLQQRGLKPSLASVVVVLGVIVVGVGVVLLTVRALVVQTAELSNEIDRALAELAASGDEVGLTISTVEHLREAISSIAGFIGNGLLTALVGGVNAVVGLVAGSILAMLIMYYVLKDGPFIRSWMVEQLPDRLQAEATSFFSSSVLAIRGYWAGRSVLSAAVTVLIVAVSLVMGLPLIGTIAIVNFVGGFVPYIGAFIGGGLATLLALADGGIGQALVMLTIVLTANLLLENLLEPRIMSGRLRIHPLMVLIATTAGGVLAGIVGLVLAVPATVVTIDLVRRLRRVGAFSAARARAEPVVREAIAGDGGHGPVG
jgi:putative heme transporter